MNNYVVTNIRLLEEDYLRLKEEAAKKRTSLAAIIRDKVSDKKKPAKDFAKMLLTLNTDWFTEEDYKDYKKGKAQLKTRAEKYDW